YKRWAISLLAWMETRKRTAFLARACSVMALRSLCATCLRRAPSATYKSLRIQIGRSDTEVKLGYTKQKPNKVSSAKASKIIASCLLKRWVKKSFEASACGIAP